MTNCVWHVAGGAHEPFRVTAVLFAPTHLFVVFLVCTFCLDLFIGGCFDVLDSCGIM